MPYSKEEFYTAIRIAEAAVRRESRSGRLSRLNAPQSIMDSARELQGDSMEELLNNPLAEKLLPQARARMAQRTARESALEATALGKLKEAVEEVGLVFATSSLSIDDVAIDGNDKAKEEWRDFLGALESGNKKKLIDALQGLLAGAHADLLFTDLPDVDAQYEEVPE